MSRRGSRGGIPDLEFEMESFPVQLSPVPIGQKHYAVLCIPYSPPTISANPTPDNRGIQQGQLHHIFGTTAGIISSTENTVTVPVPVSVPVPVPTQSA